MTIQATVSKLRALASSLDKCDGSHVARDELDKQAAEMVRALARIVLACAEERYRKAGLPTLVKRAINFRKGTPPRDALEKKP